MNTELAIDAVGAFEEDHVAFVDSIADLRPRLHRYCARMTGSVFDAEDIIQEALFEAYLKLQTFDTSRSLNSWLFRIAHNRCIDFIRKRNTRNATEAAVAEPDTVAPVYPAGLALGLAVERLVIDLPPKERACVLLMDVFDYTLEEIADLVDSTVGGVKAALHRGRAKLAKLEEPKIPASPTDPEHFSLLRLYVERFNRHDWDGLRELISADARLRVADCYAGSVDGAPYLVKYDEASVPWKMAVGVVDGECVIIMLTAQGNGWVPTSAIRVAVVANRVVRIRDYLRCPWVLQDATSIRIADQV